MITPSSGRTQSSAAEQDDYIVSCLNSTLIRLISAMRGSGGDEGTTSIIPCLTVVGPQQTSSGYLSSIIPPRRSAVTCMLGQSINVLGMKHDDDDDDDDEPVVEGYKQAFLKELHRMFDQHKEALGLGKEAKFLIR